MLRTKRLYLRNLRSDDVDVLFGYRNDSSCNRYQRYDHRSREELQAFVREFSNSSFLSKEPEQHYAIVCSEMIGDLSVFFSEEDNCFTLGITVAPAFQRRGFAYELLQEVIGQLRTAYADADVVALIEKENINSIGLFQKLGFAEECYADSIESYVFTLYAEGKEQL